MSINELSRKEKYELMANKLMIKDLNYSEVLAVIKEYFEDCDYNDLAPITLSGMKFCFDLDNPMVTAGIYYNNISKVSEIARLKFLDNLLSTFKNMIMEMGKTNIKIKTPEDYRRIQSEYTSNFNQKPPKSIKIFNTILNDEKSIKKMMNHPEYYLRVKKIFSFIDKEETNKLKSILLEGYENRINELNSKKLKGIGKEDKTDLEIHFIEKRIKLLNNDEKWIK